MVETLIYVIGAVLLVGAIVTILTNMYRWYDRVTLIPRVDQAGVTLIDRMIREIRTGSIINDGLSSFDSEIGSISMESKVDGATKTKYLGVQSGRLFYQENNGTPVYISSPELSVTKFILKKIDTPISSAVRIEIELTYLLRGVGATRVYSGLAITKNSY